MMKVKYMALGTALALVVAGCTNGNAGKETDEVKNAEKLDHMHGLSYSTDGKTLYLATHEGLYQSSDQGDTWNKTGTANIDFMGFHVKSDGTMITSGHPGEGSDLPHPLGFMISKNAGESWEPVSLQGKVDFHVLESNAKRPDLIYGLIQMGEGEYGAGIYKSADGGKTWQKIEAKGLPDDLHKVISLYSDVQNPDRLLAGTEGGVLESKDGGKTWTMLDNARIITAMETVAETQMISYSITGKEKGVMISKDGGLTWESIGLDLGKDAVAYFSVNHKNPAEIAAATFESSVYVTQDGGKTWNRLIDNGNLQ